MAITVLPSLHAGLWTSLEAIISNDEGLRLYIIPISTIGLLETHAPGVL